MAEIVIPGYQIIREIGHGGMSTVYLAKQEPLDRKVALKVMAPALAADRTFGDRFLREGKTVAEMDHPGVLRIFTAGVVDYHYYMAMEYVPGGDLKQQIRRGSLDGAFCLKIVEQVAAALGYAHAKGFVHRDVKPENILFKEDGSAVLSDFGIAKAVGSGSSLTGTGMTIGTPHYMSPEQAKGKGIDHRTDLYSLGVVFYEMLTGRVPYEADNSVAIAVAHIHNEIPELPEALNSFQPLLKNMLEKDPDQRFASAEDLIAGIRNLRGELSEETLISSGERPVRSQDDAPSEDSPAIHLVSDTVVIEKLEEIPSKTKVLPSGQHEQAKVDPPPDKPQQKKSSLLPKFAVGAVCVVIAVVAFALMSGDNSGFEVGLRQAPQVARKEVAENPPAEQKGTDDTEEKKSDEQDDVDGQVDIDEHEETTVADVGPERDLSRAERVKQLLVLASQDLKLKRLTLPKDRCAYDRYQKVLELDPNNRVAKEGIKEVGKAYLDLFDARLKTQNFTLAERYLGKASEILGTTSAVKERTALLAKTRSSAVVSAPPSVQPAPVPNQVSKSPGGSYETWIAKGQAALIKKDRKSAAEACSNALFFKPNDPFAQQCVEQAAQGYKGGEIFSDRLSNGKPGPELVVVPKGEFPMGDIQNIGGNDEKPLHKVTFRKPFAISRTEVTFGLYDQFCHATGRKLSPTNGTTRSRLPASNVSWLDAVAFTQWLSKSTGQSYRLPSEAEWEYAARGGTKTPFWWGTAIGSNRANCDGCGSRWDNKQPAPVGSFKTNGYKLFDVTGNVWEWCLDTYHQNYKGAPKDGSSWTGSGSQKVYRGGSYLFDESNQRISFRNYGKNTYKSKDLGFRVVREL